MDQRLVLVPRNPWWILRTNGIYLHWWLTLYGIKINIPVWINHGIFVICLEILKMWNMENSGLVGKDVSVFVGFRTGHLLDMQWKTLLKVLKNPSQGMTFSETRKPQIIATNLSQGHPEWWCLGSGNPKTRIAEEVRFTLYTHTPEV